MKELDALHEVLQQTARSDTANVVTQTGQSQSQQDKDDWRNCDSWRINGA